MQKNIAILGCGTAGIHLAYELLRTQKFAITIFTPQTMEEVRSGRIRSTQVHFSSTVERERRYGMPEWPNAEKLGTVHVSVGGQTLFAGRLDKPAYSVDQRYYFSTCMSDLHDQGVHFVFEKITSEELPQLVERFDAVVDCTGRAGPIAPFPEDSELSPVERPLRKCSVGYFRGVKFAEPTGVIAHIIPEQGELFEIPAITEQGPVTILFVEAVPDGKLDVFHKVHDHGAFTSQMLEVTESFFPEIRQRIDEVEFQLCDEGAYLRVAIQPKVRTPYCELNGKWIVGCGDSVVLNDPITGQGDNTASYMTEQLVSSLVENFQSSYNAATYEAYWQKSKPYVKHVVNWSNAMLGPLPEHIVAMLMEGRSDESVANRIANWFRVPSTAYNDFCQENEVHQNV